MAQMTRFGVVLLAVVLAACALFTRPVGVVLVAQTLPLTKDLAWDAAVADATHDAATSYAVRLDGVLVAAVPAAQLSQAVTFTTLGAHTLTVTAVNAWGASAPASLSVKVNAPNGAANLRMP